MGVHSFRIFDGKGIEVYRRVQAPRGAEREHAAAYDPTTRVSTGIPGLDELANGGYFVGSTTLVVGISGVGKSVMGLQYLAEGVRRGERGFMITLDEPPAQVVRNATSTLRLGSGTSSRMRSRPRSPMPSSCGPTTCPLPAI